MHQTSINAGTLMYWSKGFACPGAEGKDPAALLDRAFSRQKFPVKISVLLNDSLGPLMAARREHGDSACVGVILGTGTNAAYVEAVRDIKKLPLSEKVG
jgi:hexokinase